MDENDPISEITQNIEPPLEEASLPLQFYRDLVACLTEPKQFFEVRYPKLSMNYVLAFGVLVNWVASMLDWLTRTIRHETLLDGLLKMKDKLQVLPFWKNLPSDIWAQAPDPSSMFPAWLAEVFGVALSPFQSLFHFLIRGLILWIGLYLLLPRDSTAEIKDQRDAPELSHAIKLTAICSAPNLVGSILGFLPLSLGTLVAAIYSIALLIIALTTRFKISGLRAFAMMILPGILAMFVFGCILAVFGALLFGSLAAIFGAS